MKAMRLTKVGKGEPFEAFDKPDAAPGPNEVAIRIHAAGLNMADVKIREGMGPDAPPPASVLGFDAAGIVEAVGPGVTRFATGDEVYGCVGGMPGLDGAFSERMIADARLMAKKPKNLDFRQTAALPLTVITAWEALVDRARVQPGELVLVHGGTGGVGHFGIQISRAQGAIVHATVSSPEKAQIARDLGADDTIDYHELSVADYVSEKTGGRGYDVVFDTVGGKNIENAIAAVATNGRVATIVPGDNVDLTGMSQKNATLHMVLMLIPLMTGNNRERHGQLLDAVTALVEAGRLHPLVDQHRFTLDTVGAALDFFDSGEAIGKVVVDVA
ncbi:zinc-binding dehydrogenase [Celeribacter halophilus]|uniref:zinc-binding dehydrogenase n=1 Tax=Celeribacter halophilus TaxID=576117 RepID=UPI003A9109B2